MKAAFRLLLAALLAAAAGSVHAAPYTLTQLQVAPGLNTYAFAINNAGAVLGSVYNKGIGNGVDSGFVWQSGEIRFLPVAEWSYGSRGRAINQSGDVAGYEYGAHGQNWATVWSGASKRYFPQSAEYTQAVDINAQGAVVTNGNGGYTTTSMLWSGSQGQVLDALSARFDDTDPASPFVPTAQAWAINDLNQVVGASGAADHSVHAVMWRDGQIVDLYGGIGRDSVATDINNAGQIVVNTTLADNVTHAGLWNNGSLRYLDAPGAAEGLAINVGGAVVGWAATAAGEHHAFLWEAGLGLDLNTLVSGGMGEFAYLEAAYGINELGQIVGQGRTSAGGYRAFLLTPVPEPGQWALLIWGLGIVWLRRQHIGAKRGARGRPRISACWFWPVAAATPSSP